METDSQNEGEKLRRNIELFREELLFAVKYFGMDFTPVIYHATGIDCDLSVWLAECETLVDALTVNHAKPSVDIVYINAGGAKLAVNKTTLLLAPTGSVLANMASDVWGHDLDSDGNIFQDVNSELFTAIINHLRLKALLPASDVPPIVVYKEQKTALDNLLTYLMCDTLQVKVVN
eukprot:gene29684-biopygen25397